MCCQSIRDWCVAMIATPTAIADVIRLQPEMFTDHRGHFFESFNQEKFASVVGRALHFVQDNQSWSRRGVIRGLHYQIAPKAQAKLVRVLSGEIFDVAVDVRRGSPTFGKWVGERLSAANRYQLWIPVGFAHGFQVLSDAAEVQYKVTDYWSAEHERSLRWDDKEIGIAWPIGGEPILSGKDAKAPFLSEG
jgi:dTDP-4-dehydrorhamnose 3,5-epimerase